jgi:uncharacterized protein
VNYYFDTSALVKRYIVEVGSQWVSTIAAQSNSHLISTSHLTLVEMVSAFARRQRENTMTLQAVQLARQLVEAHFQQNYEVVRLTDLIANLANDLLQHHPLRAYDAVQLACALTINTRFLSVSNVPITFVSADQRLISVAITEGLLTDDPNLHP